VSSGAVFRRADFEDRCREARRSASLWPLFVFILGFLALFAVMTVLPDLPARTVRIGQFTILGAAIAAMFLNAARQDRTVKRLGLRCPGCDSPLFGGRRYRPNIEDGVLQTGKCEQCGQQIIDPGEIGPRAAEEQRGSNAKAIGFIGILAASLVATMYLGNSALAKRRALACRRQYAAARTPMDSVAADQYRLSRRGTITCGDLRRGGKLGA